MFVEENPSTDLQDLKKIREDRGISLEDLYKKTRIRVVYLRAIESKNFDLLPAPVYSKNFIKMYADALGIDREKLIKEYQDFLASRKEISPQVEQSVKKETFSFAQLAGRKSYPLLVFILFIIILGVFLMNQPYPSSNLLDPSNNQAGLPKDNGDKYMNADMAVGVEKSTEPAGFLQENIKKQPKVGTTFSSDRESGLLVVTAMDETWLRVKIDDNPPFQILLKAGEQFEQKAKNVSLDIGNAGGIKITFKGKDIGRPGKAGEVIHLRLP